MIDVQRVIKGISNWQKKKEHILKQTVKGTLIGTQLQTNSMFKRFYLETKNKFALVGSGLWGIIFGRGQHVTNILCVYIYILSFVM